MVPPPSRHVRVDHVSAVYAATRAARETGRAAGLPDVLTERAAVVTSELAGNLDKHAVNGSVVVQRATTGLGVDVLAADDGPGMADVEHWLLDGNTTTATLGTGLGAVSRMATVFRIRSAPGRGTLAAARVLAPGTPVGQAAAMAHFCLPRSGESQCGDAIAVAPTTGGWTALVADGLGHGPDAAQAAGRAVEVFAQNPDRPPSHQLANMHRALRGTRGAAIALARVTPRRLEFCGVGNISGTTLHESGRSGLLLSIPGIVGFTLPVAQVRQTALAEGDLVVLHTDGIDPGWRTGPAWAGNALLLAAELAHHHRNPRDDAAVLALHPDRIT
ncbi:Anti-sigma regulatory factor (Ser/Thr protein kinase) [Amycolatopsis australiensis]|uniref:Anti-sigma regulatory factor (Ser/Thr protein kinase) n=1 Tax=Amycolatopsis australiensis TaxID=546364 RepID=A0A1K1R6N9_9PSEU|nr:Anti-sigma regulatory factor (Ser/Thr protein kinase) [Amycolatopsis australiensis]